MGGPDLERIGAPSSLFFRGWNQVFALLLLFS